MSPKWETSYCIQAHQHSYWYWSLQIIKNLQVCEDCHTSTKFISENSHGESNHGEGCQPLSSFWGWRYQWHSPLSMLEMRKLRCVPLLSWKLPQKSVSMLFMGSSIMINQSLFSAIWISVCANQTPNIMPKNRFRSPKSYQTLCPLDHLLFWDHSMYWYTICLVPGKVEYLF